MTNRGGDGKQTVKLLTLVESQWKCTRTHRLLESQKFLETWFQPKMWRKMIKWSEYLTSFHISSKSSQISSPFRKMRLNYTALILIDNLHYFDVLCLCLQWILQAYCWRLCASACNVRSVVHNFYCLTVRLVKSKLVSALLTTAPKTEILSSIFLLDTTILYWQLSILGNSETCDFDFA